MDLSLARLAGIVHDAALGVDYNERSLFLVHD